MGLLLEVVKKNAEEHPFSNLAHCMNRRRSRFECRKCMQICPKQIYDTVDFETCSKSDFRAVKVLACEAVKKNKKLLQFTLDDGDGKEHTLLSGIHAYYEPEELVGKTLLAITNLPPRPMMGIESCGMLISAVHTEEGAEKLHLLMLDNHIPAGAKMY